MMKSLMKCMLLIATCLVIVARFADCKSYRTAYDERLAKAEVPTVRLPNNVKSYAFDQSWSSWSSHSSSSYVDSQKSVTIVRSFGGNSAGANCYFPFVYKGIVHYSCTNSGRTDSLVWCSTTPSYDRDNRYGFCRLQSVSATVVTSKGNCEFPFIFKRQVYYGCTTDGMADGRSWCSLDWDYDGRRRWGICPTVVPSVQVQVQVQTETETETAATIDTSGTTNIEIETFAGNGNNKPCASSYVFQGRTYRGCTTDGRSDDLKWCATTANYDRDLTWGFCVEREYPKSLLAENRFFCAFPFVYGTHTYYACTTDGRKDGRKWCSLTHDYSKSHSWGFCPTRGSGRWAGSRRYEKSGYFWDKSQRVDRSRQYEKSASWQEKSGDWQKSGRRY